MTKSLLSAIAALSIIALAFILAGPAHAQSCDRPNCPPGTPRVHPQVVVDGPDVAKAPMGNGILNRSSASSSAALLAASLGGLLVAIALTGIVFRRWQAVNAPDVRPMAPPTTKTARRGERLDEATGDRRSSIGSSVV